MMEEVDHYEKEAKRLSLPLRRPNSMNAYGLVIDDIGLSAFVSALRARYINPLAAVLFGDALASATAVADRKQSPATAVDSHSEVLKSHHAFTVKYKVGEDLNLATHIDASDITLNTCLGKQFAGTIPTAYRASLFSYYSYAFV
jgi:hypothetical protein